MQPDHLGSAGVALTAAGVEDPAFRCPRRLTVRRPNDLADRFADGVHFIRLDGLYDPGLVLSDCRDPDDNRILEAAVSGRADCIVTGDDDLLSMKSFRGVQILTVSEFLAGVGKPNAESG